MASCLPLGKRGRRDFLTIHPMTSSHDILRSGDSTARIWTVPEGPSGPAAIAGGVKVKVLRHVKGKNNEKSKDVTTLDWNGDGSLLATGSYDGIARIWSSNGAPGRFYGAARVLAEGIGDQRSQP